MKRVLLLFLLAFCVLRLNAQDLSRLNSDSAIKKFIIERNYSYPQNLVWAYFDFISGKELKKFHASATEQKKIAEPFSCQKWTFVDLNSDGVKDLVASGVINKPEGNHFESVYKLLVFLSKPDGLFEQLNLVKQYDENYPVYFNSLKVKGKNALELTTVVFPNPNSFQFQLRKDTVVWFHNSFVEYNPIPSPQSYNSFTYYTSSNWVTYQPTHFSVDNQRNVYTKRGAYHDSVSKELRFKMEPDDYSSLLRLLDYVNLKHMDEDYDKPGWSDLGYSHLRISFSDGTSKKIDDYGSSGTYGLVAIYNWINNYINKENLHVE